MMKHKKLQAQIDNLIAFGIPENHPELQRLKNILKELDKHPEKDWDSEEVKTKISEISGNNQ